VGLTVALGIAAYRDGGASAVGLVGLVRMVPSAVLAPLVTPVADRGRREHLLVLVSSIRGVAIHVLLDEIDGLKLVDEQEGNREFYNRG
jgi:ABC-type nitrate/sulfonate/bicarbonate transport system permease component